MTLVITIVAPWGVWQCSDHRLTNPTTGKSADDFAVKQFSVTCPDGVALIAYTGLGRIGPQYVSDWIGKVLQGEVRTLQQSFQKLRDELTTQVGRKAPLILNAGAYVQGRMFFIGVTNAKKDLSANDRFKLLAAEH